jgi:hypothetical protein
VTHPTSTPHHLQVFCIGSDKNREHAAQCTLRQPTAPRLRAGHGAPPTSGANLVRAERQGACRAVPCPMAAGAAMCARWARIVVASCCVWWCQPRVAVAGALLTAARLVCLYPLPPLASSPLLALSPSPVAEAAPTKHGRVVLSSWRRDVCGECARASLRRGSP